MRPSWKNVLRHVPALPGAKAFVDHWPGPVFLVSSAPEVEALAQLTRLGFRDLDGYVTAGTRKADALAVIRRSQDALVFFGDAAADAQAAREASCPFVAVGPRRHEFEADALVSVPTLQELLRTEQALADAVLAAPRS